ncbi:MAG TPA: NADH-quinone oxidoreductase subunit C [Bacillota bacterium]|nr:NADH-quinone oxidoreductase subunit C [Bacillota bacterium]
MIENVTEITKEALLGFVQEMRYNGYRFVTATCVDNGDGTIDVLYHFDKDLEMKHARVKVQKGEELSSITGIYFCAILVENEMKELFGLNIVNIAIDYGGHMLLSDEELTSPMARQITVVNKEAAAQ